MNTYESSPSLRAAIERLAVHDHLCLIYETRAEQFAALIPFVRSGLERGEQCIYIADDNTAQTVLEALQGGAIDTGAALSSGALAILSKREAYLTQGTFDPDWMIDFLAESTRGAHAAGFSALRVTGEMTWMLGGEPGVERLIEYEAKLNHFFPAHDALAICQYNRARFSPELILDVIRTHPLVIAGGTVCRNFYYVPPDELLKPEQPRHEVDRLLANLREREQSDEALRESEERFRRLVQASFEGIAIHDQGRILDANQALADLFGYGLSAIIGMNALDLTAPESRDLVRQNMLAGYREPFEAIGLRKDGSTFACELSAKPILYHGRVISVTALRDIGERKRAEEELGRSAARLRQAQELARLGTWEWDPVSDTTVWSDEMLRIYGITRDEFTGRGEDYFGFTHPDDQHIQRENIRRDFEQAGVRARASGELVDVMPDAKEFRIVRKDGMIRWVRGDAVEVVDARGRPVRMYGILWDITERKQSDDALKKSEALLNETGRMANVGGWEFDTHTLDLVWTAEVYRIHEVDTTYTPTVSRAIGFYAPASRPIIERAVQRAIEFGEPFDLELEIITAKGNLRSVHAIGNADRERVFGTFQDVTERKRTEEALRKSEERFRNLAENANDIVFRYRLIPTPGFEYVSPAATVVNGYTPDEHYADPDLGRKLTHPDDLHVLEAALRGQIRQRETHVHRWRRKDGAIIWVEQRRTPIIDEDGSVVAIEGVVRDISERKRAEQALAESEVHYRSLVEGIPGIVYSYSDQRGGIYYSPHVEDILGYSPEYLYVHPQLWHDSIHPDDRPHVDEVIRDLPAGRTFHVEYRICDAQGRWRWFDDRMIEQGGEGGETVISGLALDITARKQAEEALAHERDLLYALMDNIPDNVYFKDTASRFTRINRTQARFLGVADPEQAIGKTDADFQPPEQARAFYSEEQAIVESGQPIVDRIEFNPASDGQPRWLSATKVPIRDREGRVTGTVGISRDISARMRGQEQLRRRLAELEALHTVSAALRSAQTMDEALPILLDETLAALETDAGAIMLYQPASGSLHVAVARGWYVTPDTLTLKPGEGVGGTVFATGQAHLAVDFHSDPLTFSVTRERIPAGWGGVCLPIRTGAIAVGVLFVSVPPARQITPEQVKLLESLAEMGGAALHRMRLHEATVRQLSQLQALHDIDRAISASTDLRITLDVVLGHVAAQLGVDAAAVLLLNPYTHMLEYASGRGFRTRQAQMARIRVGETFAGRAVQERRLVHATDAAATQASPHFALLWQQESLAEYYGVPLIAKGQVKGVLEVFQRTPLAADAHWLELLETLAGQAAIAIDNAQLFEGLQRSNLNLSLAYDATIEGWSRALDLRDHETEGHTQRVTALTLRLARAMGLSDGELVHVRRGALLHDIGKMGVPDNILLKPGPLDDSEWELMRKHPVYAYEMLAPIAYLQPALDIPYGHHEKWDGTGYPRGLKGEQIPLVARIFAVVDVWDALNSDRPYRKAWSEAEALAYIREQAGAHFDPRVVEAFLAEQRNG